MRGVKIKKRSIVVAILSILFVLAFVVVAMYLPKAIMTITDNKSMNQPININTDITVSRDTFKDFSEEMKVLSDEYAWMDNYLQILPIVDKDYNITNEALTIAVNRQLTTLIYLQILDSNINVNKANLTERQMLSLYTETEGNELNGIRFWKLKYQGDNIDCTIYMDVDFFKIVLIDVSYRNTGNDSTNGYLNKHVLNYSYLGVSGTTASNVWWTSRLYDYYEVDGNGIELITRQKTELDAISRKSQPYGDRIQETYGYYSTQLALTYYDVDLSAQYYSQAGFGIYNLFSAIQEQGQS